MSSAITSIPAELVATVFTLVLNVLRPLDAEGRAFFKALRDVCSQWREIALETPVLWRSLDIDVGTTPATSVASWFRRGGTDSHPSLVVRVRPHEQPAVPDGLNFDSLKALLESYQWSRLDLQDLAEVEEMMGIVGVYESCRPSYTTLHTFAIQCQPATQENGLNVTTSAFPQLRDLYVGHHNRACIPSNEHYDLNALVINHANLTSLHLSYMSCHETLSNVVFSELVAECNLPSLQELVVCWFLPLYPDDRLPGGPPPIRCNSSVKKLILEGRTSIYALQYIVFPSLQLFRMTFMRVLYQQPLEILHGFLQSSSPSTLSMESAYLYDVPLDMTIRPKICLMAAHGIRELNIRSAEWIWEMDVANREVFPRLEKITVMKNLPPSPSPLLDYIQGISKDTTAHISVLIISVPRSPVNLQYMRLIERGGPLGLEVRRESEDELTVLSYSITAHLYSEHILTARPSNRLGDRYGRMYS